MFPCTRKAALASISPPPVATSPPIRPRQGYGAFLPSLAKARAAQRDMGMETNQAITNDTRLCALTSSRERRMEMRRLPPRLRTARTRQAVLTRSG